MYNKQEEVFIVCFFTKKIKICEKSLKKLSYNERRNKGNKQTLLPPPSYLLPTYHLPPPSYLPPSNPTPPHYIARALKTSSGWS